MRSPGQYYDLETGLQYNLNRYYDPLIGRYTQEDPIRLKGNDLNLYRFVENNPIIRIDPLGLWFVAGNYGYGLAFHAGIAGVNGSCGGAAGINSGLTVCSYCQACLRLGPGIYGGAGQVAGVSFGKGSVSNSGGLSVGAGFDIGTGTSIGGSVGIGIDENGANSGSAGKGRGGFGGGLSAGVEICWTKLWCREFCGI